MTGTNLILGLTILVSALGFLSPRFLEATVLRPWRIAHGQDYSSLIMSGFVHGNLLHIFLNLFTLYAFGPTLEQEIGTPRFVLLYLAGLLASSLGVCLQHRNEPDYAALGASGAILAVLFASIVYFPQHKILFMLIPVPIPGPLFAVGFLLISYLLGRNRRAAAPSGFPGEAGSPPPAPAPRPLLGGPVNHDAHIFGALTGLAFVAVENPERFQAMLRYIQEGGLGF